jgi:hypothetical protein
MAELDLPTITIGDKAAYAPSHETWRDGDTRGTGRASPASGIGQGQATVLYETDVILGSATTTTATVMADGHRDA